MGASFTALTPIDARRATARAALSRAASRSQGAILSLSLLCLATVYVILAASLSRYHAVWSADSGALLAMVQAQLAGHGVAALPYANAAVDPDGQIHPLAFYAAHGPRGLFLEYPPLFPWLCAPLCRALGFPGLTLLPLLSGVGAALATALTARRLGLPGWPWLPLVLGVSTPLLLYSVVFWVHAPLMLLTALAGLLVLRALGEGDPRRRAGFALAAGVAFGAGVWLHELLGMLFLAALAALTALPRSQRPAHLALGLLAGFVPCLLLWALANWWLYGLWGGPHLAGNVASPRDHLYGWRMACDLPYLGRRVWLQLVGAEAPTPRTLRLGALLLAVALAGGLARRAPKAVPWLAVPLCLAAALVGLSLLPKNVPFSGLFAATPLLIPALLLVNPPAPRRRKEEIVKEETVFVTDPKDPPAAGPFVAWLGRACLLFSLLVLVNPIPPGMDWGSRYLLTALPWLALLALWAWRGLARSADRRGQSVAAAGLACLVGLSVCAQAWGLAAVRRDLAFSREVIGAAQGVHSPVLVTDLAWLGPELVASPGPLPPQYLVRSGGDRLLLLDTLRSRTAGLTPSSGFTYMGSFEGLDLLARAVAHADPPLSVAATWEGAGLRLARFAPRVGALKARPAPKAAPPASRGSAHRVLAMYYPWYATPQVSGHWAHQDGVDAAHKRMTSHTHYPLAGPYDSADPKVIERHLTEAKAAGIDTLVCSWGGPKDPSDKVLRLLLRAAPAHGLTACAYWERPTKSGDVKATGDELAALLGTVGQAPGYLKVDGRPVVFLYGEACRSLTPEQWATVLKDAAHRAAPGAFAIGDGMTVDNLLLWDGWHTLDTPEHLTGPDGKTDAAAAARAQGGLFATADVLARRLHGLSVETVEPGFDDRRPNAAAGVPAGSLLDRLDGSLYRALWERAISDGPDWVLINSFNEWHNGTEIEPSVEEGDKYLALTRQEADRFKGVPAARAPRPASGG